jgi:hypothetical protein
VAEEEGAEVEVELLEVAEEVLAQVVAACDLEEAG